MSALSFGYLGMALVWWFGCFVLLGWALWFGAEPLADTWYGEVSDDEWDC